MEEVRKEIYVEPRDTVCSRRFSPRLAGTKWSEMIVIVHEYGEEKKYTVVVGRIVRELPPTFEGLHQWGVIPLTDPVAKEEMREFLVGYPKPINFW